MQKIYTLLFLLLSCTLLYSQYTPSPKMEKIYGTVTDEKDVAMPGVTVSLKDRSIGVLTDSAGHYELRLPLGSHSLDFNYIGYAEQHIPLLLRDTTPRLMDIKMQLEGKDMSIVVVTGSKYEKRLEEEVVSMEVMKATVINQNNNTMEEAINQVPGVNMLDNTMSIRGGSGFSDQTGNRVMTLLDGMPILSPDNGGVWWQSLPIEQMEQMEVIKGSSSALYGSSAEDGVLNIRTVDPTPEGVNNIQLDYGFYGQPKNKEWDWFWTRATVNHNGDTVRHINRPMFGGGQFLHAKQYGDVGVVISGAVQRDEGFRENNDFTLVRFGGKLKYTPHRLKRLTVGLSVNAFYQYAKDFFVSLDTGKQMYLPYQISETGTMTYNIDPSITYWDKKNNKHSLKFRVYGVTSNSTTGDSSTSVNYYGEYSFLRRFENIDLVLTTGVCGSFSDVKGKTFGNIGEAYYNTRYVANTAAYVQAEKRFFHRLTLSGGMRLEYTKLDTSQIYYPFPLITKWEGRDSAHMRQSPVAPLLRFGLNFQAAKNTFLRASIGQGFRYPTLAEKFIFSTRSGAEVFPNPNLLPESGWSSEIGVKQVVRVSEWTGYFDLAGYVTRYRNLIDFEGYNAPLSVLQTAIGVPFQAVNINRALIAGVEVSAIANGKIWGIPLNFIAGYNYLYPENLDYNPNDPNSTKILKYRIQHSAKADIQATYKGVFFGISGFYNSFMKNIDNATFAVFPSVTAFRETHDHGDFVMDLRAGYKIKDKVTLSMICKNILDTEYTLRPGLIEPPRNFTFQVGYKF